MFDDYLITLSSQPLLLGLALFGATFVAEDAATVAAGVLVARAGIDPVAALSGLILGTAVGDLALYALGRWGAGTQLGAKLRGRNDVRRAESWIADRALLLVFAARFLPGSRLPVFTASGLVAAPVLPVAAIIAVTTPIWTGTLFALARCAGEAGARDLVTAACPAAVLLVAATMLFRRTSRGRAPSTI